MLLEKLSQAFGVSGSEEEVRQILKDELKPFVDRLETDVLGNLLVYKKGTVDSPRVMICAHMDEVGMMVVDIDDSGLLKFKKVGGIDDRVLVSKPVMVGPDRIKGVIGAKAIHLQKKEERGKSMASDQLYIDIGAASEEEAKKNVKAGDYISFAISPRRMGQDGFMGKALDNRVGCWLLAELLQQDLPLSVHGAFTVQEEVGLRGAGVAAYTINPDLALVLETTTALDVLDNKEHLHATSLGKGPALTLMDSSFVSHKKVLDFIMKTAAENHIPYQFRRFTGAGTDAGRISLIHEGIPVGVISTPCRYLHGPRSLINLKDAGEVGTLLHALLKSLAKGGLDLCKDC